MKAILYITLAAVLALSLAVAGSFRAIRNQSTHGRASTCQALDRLNNTFAGLIIQSEKTLPSLFYYKQHPAELRLVLAQDKQAIQRLRASLPSYCH